ncbi:MAG TPA: glutathione S-transferase family protein [Casimicrobiaceae bacterium]|nr:glutathione S-transferase family protein [Casimicrobiaceae bacterium]
MLKIWGRITSINVQKVVICAEELGLRFERVDAGGQFGIVNTPEYKRLNPNALIPVIEDGDFVLWESNAIVRYLARTHGGGGLWPDDPKLAADADRWMDWQATTVTPAMTDAFWQLIRTPSDKRDAAALQASIAKTEPKLAILDAHLAQRDYAVGNVLTMADIPLACAAHRWLGLPCEREARPNVERYAAAIRKRPAFAKYLTLPIV